MVVHGPGSTSVSALVPAPGGVVITFGTADLTVRMMWQQRRVQEYTHDVRLNTYAIRLYMYALGLEMPSGSWLGTPLGELMTAGASLLTCTSLMPHGAGKRILGDEFLTARSGTPLGGSMPTRRCSPVREYSTCKMP